MVRIEVRKGVNGQKEISFGAANGDYRERVSFCVTGTILKEEFAEAARMLRYAADCIEEPKGD